MKRLLETLDKVLDNRIRLAVATLLMVNDRLDYSQLVKLLGVSDGNLASNMTAMEKAGYVAVEKRFVGKRPKTAYSLTPEGREAVTKHLKALEEILRRSPTFLS